jgi:hypothetical protein
LESERLERKELKKEVTKRKGLKGFVLGNLRKKQLDFAVQLAERN